METTKSQLILFVLLFSIGLWYVGAPYFSHDDALASAVIVQDTEQKDIAASTYFVPIQPKLEAKSIYVYDIKAGQVLYAKDENIQLPLASLTKIMTALTAYELAPASTTIVSITQESLKPEGDSGLYWLEKWRLKDLIDFTLIVSSNDGASAIAESLQSTAQIAMSNTNKATGTNPFLQAMNYRAKVIGMNDTEFMNATGLDTAATSSGAVGTAKDISTLFTYIYKNHPELFEMTRNSSATFTSLSNITHQAKNTNKIIGKLPFLIGSKTGFTDLAGGNLAVIFDGAIDRPIVAVVMGSTAEGRFTDMVALTEVVGDYLSQKESSKEVPSTQSTSTIQ